MPRFELDDTVVLRSNRNFVGAVTRTPYDSHEPLVDCLIIAHVQVSPAALNEFVESGIPPKDHVFVQFCEAPRGSSLVHQDDIELLDRSFNLGDLVKQAGSSILGTVVDVAESYALQPAWQRRKNASRGPEVTSDTPFDYAIASSEPSSLPHDANHASLSPHTIFNVPGSELKRAEDVLEGDYILKDEWFGIVLGTDMAVVLLLDDGSIVVVDNCDDLYTVVPEYDKPLVSLPEYGGLPRPDVLVSKAGYTTLIVANGFVSGQFVVTNTSNLQRGRWIEGRFDPKVPPHGRILDVRCRDLEAKWLVPNPLIPREVSGYGTSTSRSVHVYDNTSTFTKSSDLRRRKNVVVLDAARAAQRMESRTRRPPEPRENDDASTAVHFPTDFRVGDHVRFRDQAGAALKYQGRQTESGALCGAFDRIMPAESYGFDVNELTIVRTVQEVTVRWQTGDITTSISRELEHFPLLEVDVMPGDLVVARDGLLQRPSGMTHTAMRDYNEMTFFEQDYDLFSTKVGIVQSMDTAERIAGVRWFSHPKIHLCQRGTMLGGDSRFGSISTDVDEMSLYEIMTFPALTRRLRDLVAIAGQDPCASAFADMNDLNWPPVGDAGPTALSQLTASPKVDIITYLRTVARMILADNLPQYTLHWKQYQKLSGCDWIGEIAELGLDGMVRVRLTAHEVCKDVLLEHDQIICFIDDEFTGDDDVWSRDEDMDVDSSGLSDSDSVGSVSAISETIEYEGGHRMDEDSGEENWEDDQDPDDMFVDGQTQMGDHSGGIDRADLKSCIPVPLPSAMAVDVLKGQAASEPVNQLDEVLTEASSAGHQANVLHTLKPYLSNTEPASFGVLDTVPPSHAFKQNVDEASPPSPTFLKRVAREHRILKTALPQREIYVRTYESRLDLLRCLIIGPADTPYEYAPFLVDLYLGPDFPKQPPTAYFHSWTTGLGRVNPNLYEEGKICLSLLGTWAGKNETEGWTEKATILQVLVSLQGLVFVRNPFYNEAGFEGYEQDKAYTLESQQYNEKAFVLARGFVKHALARPIPGLEDVLAWLYTSQGLLAKITLRSQALMAACKGPSHGGEDGDGDGDGDEVRLLRGDGTRGSETNGFLRPLSKGAMVMLGKTTGVLQEMLRSMES